MHPTSQHRARLPSFYPPRVPSPPPYPSSQEGDEERRSLGDESDDEGHKIDLQHIREGGSCVKCYQGTSRFADLGISSRRITSFNAIRVVFDLEHRGCSGEDLLGMMMTRDLVEETVDICSTWEPSTSPEVEEIHELPIFRQNLDMIDSEYDRATGENFLRLLRRLRDLAELGKSAAAIISQPSEVVTIFAITTGERNRPAVFVVFDHSPRPDLHPLGAAFVFFGSPSETSSYLAKLFATSGSTNSSAQRQGEATSQYTAYYVVGVNDPLSQTAILYEANMTILNLKPVTSALQQKMTETLNQNAKLHSEIHVLKKQLRELNRESLPVDRTGLGSPRSDRRVSLTTSPLRGSSRVDEEEWTAVGYHPPTGSIGRSSGSSRTSDRWSITSRPEPSTPLRSPRTPDVRQNSPGNINAYQTPPITPSINLQRDPRAQSRSNQMLSPTRPVDRSRYDPHHDGSYDTSSRDGDRTRGQHRGEQRTTEADARTQPFFRATAQRYERDEDDDTRNLQAALGSPIRMAGQVDNSNRNQTHGRYGSERQRPQETSRSPVAGHGVRSANTQATTQSQADIDAESKRLAREHEEHLQRIQESIDAQLAAAVQFGDGNIPGILSNNSGGESSQT